MRTMTLICWAALSLSLAPAYVIPADAQSVEVTAQATVNHLGAGADAITRSNEGVVLWLVPLGEAASAASSSTDRRHAQLAQKNKQFVPHVVAVQVGGLVDFPNQDPFFHNVFSLFNGKRFDLGLYESGSSRSVRFNRPGISYIFCNIHPEMSAVVVSVPTPYFAVSNSAGALAIHDVPAGSYDLHVWSLGSSDASLTALSRHITVADRNVDLGAVTLSQSSTGKHQNKFGEDYKDQSSPYN